MGKSISDYYAERMQKLLEANQQNTAAAPTPLSAPSPMRKNAGAAKTAAPGRNYYDNFRKSTNTAAGRWQDPAERAQRPQRPTGRPAAPAGGQPPKKGAPYAPPRATVQGDARRESQGAPRRKTPEQTVADRQREEAAHAEAMERARRARRFRKMRDAFVSFVLILAVFAAMCFAVYRLLFVISDISGDGSNSYSSDEIVAASGIMEGDHLYSFRSSVVTSLISHRLPQITDVDVQRTVPSTIVFNVTEEPCCYYADFYGEYRGISKSMRVLFSMSAEEAEKRGLVLLKLPAVQNAVAGDRAVFAILKNDSYIYDTVSAVAESELGERISVIDLRSKYDVQLVCDNKYLMILGEAENIETKLRIAKSVLKDDMFNSDDKARIDLSDLSKTSVVVDNTLEFD